MLSFSSFSSSSFERASLSWNESKSGSKQIMKTWHDEIQRKTFFLFEKKKLNVCFYGWRRFFLLCLFVRIDNKVNILNLVIHSIKQCRFWSIILVWMYVRFTCVRITCKFHKMPIRQIRNGCACMRKDESQIGKRRMKNKTRNDI